MATAKKTIPQRREKEVISEISMNLYAKLPFGERMKIAREKKKEEDAKKPPADIRFQKIIQLLKSVDKKSAKDLFSEFKISDDREMYGTGKRSEIFDKQYSYLSEDKDFVNRIKALFVFSKLMPIKTSIKQELVYREDNHSEYDEDGDEIGDTEREYGVEKTSDISLQIIDKKTKKKIGEIVRIGYYNFNPQELDKIFKIIYGYFNKSVLPPETKPSDFDFIFKK